jgi:orotate phosphoribosyltransferase
MEDPESAFCSAATGLGTAVITDEGVIAGPAVAGTPVGCFAREVLRLGQSLNSIFNRQEKKESAKVNRNRRLCWTCAGPRAGCE